MNKILFLKIFKCISSYLLSCSCCYRYHPASVETLITVSEKKNKDFGDDMLTIDWRRMAGFDCSNDALILAHHWVM